MFVLVTVSFFVVFQFNLSRLPPLSVAVLQHNSTFLYRPHSLLQWVHLCSYNLDGANHEANNVPCFY